MKIGYVYYSLMLKLCDDMSNNASNTAKQA